MRGITAHFAQNHSLPQTIVLLAVPSGELQNKWCPKF